jgi:hypothetical protein
VKFDADVFRARRGQETERLAFEYERGVGSVVDHNEIIFLREFDNFGKELCGRARASWVVRIIQHKHFGFLQDVSRHGIQIRQKLIRLGQC